MGTNKDSVTPKEIILAIQDWIKFLLQRWWRILIIAAIGALVGTLYAIFTPKMYVAEANLVFKTSSEGSSSAPMGGIAQITGAAGNGDIFQGLNLIWLYNSRGMLRRALLTESKGTNKLLMQHFIDVDEEMREALENNGEQNIDNFFPVDLDSNKVTPLQEKYINVAIGIIKEDYLTVKLQEATNGVINIRFTHYSEVFAKNFVDNLMESVNSYYIEISTRRLNDQIVVLEQKIAEAETQLNTTIYETAEAVEEIPYANPHLQTIKVQPQRKAVESDVSVKLYVQLVQQLEQAKLTLAKETPVLQIVDQPRYPLIIDKKIPLIYGIIGAVVFGFLGVLGYTCIKIYRDIIN